MKKILVVILVLCSGISLLGFTAVNNGIGARAQPNKQIQRKSQQTVIAEAEIQDLVKSFGSKLQLVSLLAPQDIIKSSMQKNYSDYVSRQLLLKWISNPTEAPGRMTSSPWPDRIEVKAIKMLSKYEYEVKGEIIEITSDEKISKGIFAKRLITLTVTKINNKWLINKAVLGAYEVEKAINYLNTKYGFSFSLPESWKGYKIISSEWRALPVDNPQDEKSAITGPMISIRHPKWTIKDQRQDIPIMIISIKQWNLIEQDKYHIGAAPIGPQELSRNDRYVFALPARYDFAYPKGYEEVENIINNKSIHPILKK